MIQLLHRVFPGKYTWRILIFIKGVVLMVLAVEALIACAAASTTNTASPQPTKTVPVTVSASPTMQVLASPTKNMTSTVSSHPTKMIPVEVSAYTIEGNMADGKRTHVGACAVSTAQFPLGTIISLYNADGSFNRQCTAEDTGSNVGYGKIDLAMPGDEAGATRWGIRHLEAQVVRWGWGAGGPPTSSVVKSGHEPFILRAEIAQLSCG